MQFYFDAAMTAKSEKEKYSTFLLAIGEGGRDIFGTWTWEKVRNEAGAVTKEDDITVKGLFQKFEAHCIPKKK